mmetsp:Transcript_13659/g.41286  ORF Transcript_13659/g.41286 Transcript_13659/m.41286 type:complete len:308 (+) Transcript_13659:49-972(+)
MADAAVVVERVEFEVEGAKVVGNLHRPASVQDAPGVVVAGPMTSVKEQVTGTYAASLASKGFAALAIDHRHYGESEGEPRQYEFYPDKLKDLHAAFETMKTTKGVKRVPVSAVGVCLGGGYAARTVCDRSDVGAFAAVAAYYRDVPEMRGKDPEGFDANVEKGKAARLKYEETGELDVIPAALPPGQGDAAMTMESTWKYYGDGGRAAVSNYKNEFAVMSREHFLQFDVQSAAPKLTVPFLQLHGPNAIAPALAERFYDKVESSLQKRKVDVDSPDQTTIYDDPAIVDACTTAIAAFFREHLPEESS